MMNNVIGRLRLIGMIEGISFILLLGVAMPLKYMAGNPPPVKLLGWAHGVLFMLYLAALLHAAIDRRWSIGKILLGRLASLFPFGPFLLDPRLKKEEQQMKAGEN